MNPDPIKNEIEAQEVYRWYWETVCVQSPGVQERRIEAWKRLDEYDHRMRRAKDEMGNES